MDNTASTVGEGKYANLRYCTKCLIPETHESISFDSEGICKMCWQIDFKQTKINWNAKLKALDELIDQYRGKYNYDCIISFSRSKNIQVR